MKIKIIKQSAIMRRGGMFGYGAWPSVARTGDNKLTAVWSGGRIKHLCPFGKVMASDSFDGGMTWTEPRTLIDTPLDDRDAGLAVSGKMQILTTFNNRVATQREWNREPGIGEIREGCFADLIVLDRDPLECEPSELRDVRVLETIKRGRTVYRMDENRN